MSFRNNEYSIIPNSKRPKLFKEMETNPYGLSKLDLSQLFIYLDEKNEDINKKIRSQCHQVMKFKYYGEFLNVTNFALLYYKLNLYMVFKSKFEYSKTIFVLLELSTLFCLISVFLVYTKNKKIISGIKIIMPFGVISIIISKYISLISGVEESIHKFIHYKHLSNKKSIMLKENHFINNLEPTLDYIKINYFFFLICFLFLNDYLVNSESINIISVLLINILILIMSIIHEQIFMKIRCMIIGINIFVLMPKIRKFANSFSQNIVIITYFINSILCGISFFYIDELDTLIGTFIMNILFIIFYPRIFNYYYHKEKLFMKGMWDVPELTQFDKK